VNIEFERTSNDLVEFNIYHIANSPIIKKQILFSQIIGGLSTALIFLFIAYSSTQSVSIGVIIGSLLAGALAFVGFLYFYRAINLWQVKRMLREGNNKALLGRHAVTLSADGIFYKMEESESKMSWNSVDRVAQNGSYIFVYMGSVNALVIPKNTFASISDQEKFLNYIHSNMQVRDK
jgi:hypothetical protein